MTSRRLALFALGVGVLLAAPGCRTAGVGNLTRSEPALTRVGLSASELLADHNRNAEIVRSLEAKPSVSGKNRGRVIPGANARLAFERPRSFRLSVTATMQADEFADIGSNDREFWLRFKDSPQKAVYFCQYEPDGTSPITAGLQPDLIIDALGLRVYSETEMAAIKVLPGKEDGTVVLSQKVVPGRGSGYVKEIVLSESTRRIREQRVLAADGKTLLARARIFGYEDHKTSADKDGPAEVVFLPNKVRLEMTQDHDTMALDVTVREVTINKLDPIRRSALFVKPEPEGYDSVDLAELSRQTPELKAAATPSPRESRTTVRETRPVPPPRVRLAEPSPLGLQGRTPPNPRALARAGADFKAVGTQGVDDVVGPLIPTITDPAPEFVRANTGWRNSSVLER